jgi:lysophospholipase L1-like esterase
MFRRQFLIGVGATLITANCGGSPTSPGGVPPPPPPDPLPPPPPPPPLGYKLGITRVLAFGDSMTAGTTSPTVSFRAFDAGLRESYPFKLQTLLTARYSEQTITVTNGGKAGNSAWQDRDRFNSFIADTSPDLVLLMEGANDLNSIVPPAVNAAIDTAVGSMEDMVRDAVRRNLPVLLMTLPPQRTGGSKAGGVEYLDRFNSGLKTMAAKKGASIVDVNARLPLSLVGQDGLHPTELGYQTLADILFEEIKTRYEVSVSTALR